MDGHNQLFFNEYFLQYSFINQVKLSKNVRIWRDFYNPYCTLVLFQVSCPPTLVLFQVSCPPTFNTVPGFLSTLSTLLGFLSTCFEY